jgi:hypothetical protein
VCPGLGKPCSQFPALMWLARSDSDLEIESASRIAADDICGMHGVKQGLASSAPTRMHPEKRTFTTNAMARWGARGCGSGLGGTSSCWWVGGRGMAPATAWAGPQRNGRLNCARCSLPPQQRADFCALLQRCCPRLGPQASRGQQQGLVTLHKSTKFCTAVHGPRAT